MRVGDRSLAAAMAAGAPAKAEFLDADSRESRIASNPEAFLGILWTVMESSGLQPQAATITVSTIKVAIRILTVRLLGESVLGAI